MNQPELSVLLTTFNHESFISEALDGVLMQKTEAPFEVLVGDDGSTDGTRDLISSHAGRYPGRLAPVFPERGMGFEGGALFKMLLEHARGEYVALLDGDDFWLSEHKLQRQVDALNANPGCAICFHNTIAFFDDGARPAWRFNDDQAELSTIEDLLGTWNFIASSSVVIRRSLLVDVPEWVYSTTSTDWGLYIFAAMGGDILYLDELMSAYRLHEGGMWSGFGRLEALEEKRSFHDHLRDALPAQYAEALDYSRAKLATLTAVARVVDDPDAIVLVVSRGDRELVELGEKEGRHFPADADGWFAGEYPTDDSRAISLLEAGRAEGASHLVFPGPSLWWLAHYQGLARHLHETYECIWSDDDCAIFALASEGAK